MRVVQPVLLPPLLLARRCAAGVALITTLWGAPAAVAQPARGSESKAEFIARYRMGDEADERARLEQARRHKLDYSTPELSFKSWQAAIVRGNKREYLDGLHPEFRAQEYPDGVKAYIKNVDYLKYWYLAMYATFDGAKINGEAAEITVVFHLRGADGKERADRTTFQLRRHEQRWLYASR